MSVITEVNAIIKSNRWKAFSSLVGAFLVQFTLGSFYSFGNMTTYMTSYMRVYGGQPNITYAETVLIQCVWGMTQGISMPLSGFIINIIGERIALVGGCSIFSLGAALTYITINKNVWYVALTYGCISAFGQGIALIPTYTITMKWFPNRKGLVMGIVVGGFGGGSFIFNQIQTQIVNPDNISAVTLDHAAGQAYFIDENILNRVPNLLLILAAIYWGISMVACCLIRMPNNESDNTEEIVMENQQSSSNKNDNPTATTTTEESIDNDAVAEEQDEIKDVTVVEALKRRYFYQLWFTRFSVVLITQLVAGFYKSFGLTFINDDFLLSIVGSVNALFNCTGRLFYGQLMDKTSYRTAMSVEAVLLFILIAVYYFTKHVGKALFAAMTWAIFFTFPGTYAIMPAVTVESYGHKYGGTIYGLFFSADIPNNLIIYLASKTILENWGYLGLFLLSSVFGIFALVSTLFFPSKPNPQFMKKAIMMTNCKE